MSSIFAENHGFKSQPLKDRHWIEIPGHSILVDEIVPQCPVRLGRRDFPISMLVLKLRHYGLYETSRAEEAIGGQAWFISGSWQEPNHVPRHQDQITTLTAFTQPLVVPPAPPTLIVPPDVEPPAAVVRTIPYQFAVSPRVVDDDQWRGILWIAQLKSNIPFLFNRGKASSRYQVNRLDPTFLRNPSSRE